MLHVRLRVAWLPLGDSLPFPSDSIGNIGSRAKRTSICLDGNHGEQRVNGGMVHEATVLDATHGGLPDGDDLLGRAVRFLIDGGDEKPAAILVVSRLNIRVNADVFDEWEGVVYGVTYVVEAPRAGYDALKQLHVDELARDWNAHAVGESIREALNAVTPANIEVRHIDARFDQTPAVEGWRDDLAAFLLGRETHNQAPGPGPMRMWENLRFRSESEKRIAQALDAAGAMFLPSCRARATADGARRTVEPDFLVCWKGRWGILEVDGEPFHPSRRTVHDHARDRVFKTHGIMVVEHFDASECFEKPADVVRKFLTLLGRTTP